MRQKKKKTLILRHFLCVIYEFQRASLALKAAAGE
jgi:hypothetical protein